MHILPTRQDTAYANMAADLMLLEAYPVPDVPRFRTYGWVNPAWSFGLSQQWDTKLAALSDDGCEVVRRPTGGGLVGHANDWTYTLVVPPTAPGYRDDPAVIYRLVHEKMIAAFAAQDIETALHGVQNKSGLHPVCFEQPERFDIVLATGEKIAGAAQKRNRYGLLAQGSLTRELPQAVDWTRFTADFAVGLATYFQSEPTNVEWPIWDENRLAYETAKFASSEWNQRR